MSQEEDCLYSGVEKDLAELEKVVSNYDSLPALMAKLSASKMEVNSRHNVDLQEAKHAQLPGSQQGRRFSYSGRGAQTGAVVRTNSNTARLNDPAGPISVGHFDASTELATEVDKVVSQLDQLKGKIAAERKVALEKKRSRRPVLKNRPVDFVANAVADYLNGRNLQRTLNNPNQGLQEGPADIAELFKPFDTNQDGRLSYPDFKKGLRGLNLGLTSEECEKFAQWVDEDGDCVIDTAELHDKLQNAGKHNSLLVPPTPGGAEEEKKEEGDFRQSPVPLTSTKSLDFGNPPTPKNYTPFESPSNYNSNDDGGGDAEDFPDDATLDSYRPSTAADESFDYTQTPEKGRVSPLKLKKPEPVYPEYQTESESANAMMTSLSPALAEKSRLSPSELVDKPPEIQINLPSFDPHDLNLNFEDRVGNQPDQSLKHEVRKKIVKSSDEYGIFSPIYKKDRENPFNSGKGFETDEQVRDRLASYVKNTVAMTQDHVADILKEDEVAEEFVQSDASGVGSPLSRSVSKNTKRGTFDQVNELLTLSPGPQPEFTVSEFERRTHLKGVLQKRRDESLAELRRLHSMGSHEEQAHKETYNRTFSSHLTGASGQVKHRPGHHAEHNRRRNSLSGIDVMEDSRAKDEVWDALTPAEYYEEKVKAGQTAHDQDHDHLRGTAAAVEVSVKPVATTEYTDARCSDIAKTEKMILARLSGSGSVPALAQALKAADGSRSGVLNHEEFKRAIMRFGIELEPKQLENIMKVTNLKANPKPDVSTAVLLNNYESLKHDFMEYPKFLDNLDTRHKELHDVKHITDLDVSKTFSATGQAQLHPGKHQGRRVAKKVLAKTCKLQRSNVEKILSKYDNSKIGLVNPDELRMGLGDLGLELSDKEFKTLREEVLGGGEKDKYAITDLLPSASVFTAVCEADDFDAIQKRNGILNSTTNFRSSTVLYPEMPQAKIMTEREKKERLSSAKITSGIASRDAQVKMAWDKSDKTGSGENIQSVLGSAGLQVSLSDAEVLSKTLQHNHLEETGGQASTFAFTELCKGLGIKSNIKEIREDTRTGKSFLGTQRCMKSSQGVVRCNEEAPGGIFHKVGHRAGSIDAAVRNGSDRVLERMYHNEGFERRVDGDAHSRMVGGNRKGHEGAARYGGEHFLLASNDLEDKGIVAGNRKRMASPDVRGKKNHLNLSSMTEKVEGDGDGSRADGRLSPELVGNKKGTNLIAVESKIGSEDNVMIGRGYPREDSRGQVSPTPFKAFPTRVDQTAHGNPVSKDREAVAPSPNKRRGAPRSSSWAGSSMGEFIKLSGTPDEGKKGGRGGEGQAKTPGGTLVAPDSRSRNRRGSNSMAALPTFGPGGAPFATNLNTDAKSIRPGADRSVIVQDYFQNSPTQTQAARPPFAVEGDKPDAYGGGSMRFARSGRLHGLGSAQGYNIISNQDV